MGASNARRLTCLAVLVFAGSLLSACSPVYSIARDLIEANREQHEAASYPTPPRTVDPEPYLNRRYRPELQRVLPPNMKVGYVHCPNAPDAGGIEMVRCSIAIDAVAVPILIQNDPADRHLNTTLAMSFMRRPTLEQSVAQRINAEYGVVAQVSCPGPAMRFSIPNTYVTCNVSGGGIGKTVKIFVIGSGNWISLEAKPEPPDERALHAAYAANNGRHIRGSLIEQILLRRSRGFASTRAIDSIKCPRFMNLDNERRSYCDMKIGGEWISERVAYIHDRLAFRMAGAYVPVQRLRRIVSGAHVSLNCAESEFVFVPPSGYHWCEISGTPRYPKRLAIAAMDEEGHYDVFFTNFSQSAYAR